MAYLLLNAASYDGEILHTGAWRPCAGLLLGFMSIGVVNDIFQKKTNLRDSAAVGKLASSLQPRQAVGRGHGQQRYY